MDSQSEGRNEDELNQSALVPIGEDLKGSIEVPNADDGEASKAPEERASLVEDVEKLMAQDLARHKKFLIDGNQEWARYMELMNVDPLLDMDFDLDCVLSGKSAMRIAVFMNSLQMLLRYNVPDSKGEITEGSKSRDKKFVDKYMEDYLDLKAKVELKKIFAQIIDAVMNGETSYTFAWTVPSPNREIFEEGRGAPKSVTKLLHFFNSRIDAKVMDRVKKFLEWKDYQVRDLPQGPESDFKLVEVSWLDQKELVSADNVLRISKSK